MNPVFAEAGGLSCLASTGGGVLSTSNLHFKCQHNSQHAIWNQQYYIMFIKTLIQSSGLTSMYKT